MSMILNVLKIKPEYQAGFAVHLTNLILNVLPLVRVQLERVSSLPFHLALCPVKQQF